LTTAFFMKIESFQKHILGTAIAILCLMGVRSPFNSPAQAQPAPPPPDSATESSALPPNVYPTSPLAQVIRLTQAGVDESVIMTFVTNSGSTFNLDSDKIIYLKDIGLPNEVVTVMMQRDQQLQQQMAASAYQPPAQPAPAPDTTYQPETAPPPQPVEQPAEVTVNYFYDTLAPYGSWVDVDGYGRCWRPSVVAYNPGWQPYGDHGRWVYTDCGWYWYSDYSWGWAPFHYGRWFQHSRWGWCWAPDTVWGPSWVTWRYSSDYCGWAPLPPRAVYRDGVGFFYNGLAVSVGFDFGLSWNCFMFVPIGHFCDPHPRRYFVAQAQVTQIYNHTTVINNFNGHGRNLANRGINPEHITAVTHTPIRPVAIRDTTAPSGHGPRTDQFSRDGSTLIVGRPGSMNNPASGGHQNNHSLPSVSPAQNHSPQPNGNQSVPPTRQIRQAQVPNTITTTTHGPQDRNAPQPNDNQSAPPTRQIRQAQVPNTTTHGSQDRNEFSVPNQTQRPVPPANYNSSPTPAAPAPNHDNRTYSPRAWEQVPPPQPPRPNTYNPRTPAVTPAPNQEQHNATGAGHNNPPAAAPVPQQPQHSQPPSSPPPSSSPRSSGQNQDQGNSDNGPGNGSGRGSRR
jgi:hypothetical protein